MTQVKGISKAHMELSRIQGYADYLLVRFVLKMLQSIGLCAPHSSLLLREKAVCLIATYSKAGSHVSKKESLEAFREVFAQRCQEVIPQNSVSPEELMKVYLKPYLQGCSSQVQKDVFNGLKPYSMTSIIKPLCLIGTLVGASLFAYSYVNAMPDVSPIVSNRSTPQESALPWFLPSLLYPIGLAVVCICGRSILKPAMLAAQARKATAAVMSAESSAREGLHKAEASSIKDIMSQALVSTESLARAVVDQEAMAAGAEFMSVEKEACAEVIKQALESCMLAENEACAALSKEEESDLIKIIQDLHHAEKVMLNKRLEEEREAFMSVEKEARALVDQTERVERIQAVVLAETKAREVVDKEAMAAITNAYWSAESSARAVVDQEAIAARAEFMSVEKEARAEVIKQALESCMSAEKGARAAVWKEEVTDRVRIIRELDCAEKVMLNKRLEEEREAFMSVEKEARALVDQTERVEIIQAVVLAETKAREVLQKEEIREAIETIRDQLATPLISNHLMLFLKQLSSLGARLKQNRGNFSTELSTTIKALYSQVVDQITALKEEDKADLKTGFENLLSSAR